MNDEKKHSLLGPSKAEIWMQCGPSARKTEHYPDVKSDYALEGSLAHDISEAKLNYRLGLARAPPQCENKEMSAHTDGYINFVLAQLNGLKNPKIYVEVKVDCSMYIPECSGTADAVIISNNGMLKLIDFKYGAGHFVEAMENKQLKIYALGILSMFDFLYKIDTVSLSIYQPRLQNISTWEVTRDHLIKWGEDTLRPAAALAWAGKGELTAGEHCFFCKAKNECGAYRKKKLQEAIYDFTS